MDPCECPAGFSRYGARCLTLLNEPETVWSNAHDRCENIGAHLAVPRSQEEYDNITLAVAELQTEALTKIWLGIFYDVFWGKWGGLDGCSEVTKDFWATGQPFVDPSWSLIFVAYSPPGLADSTEGWYAVNGADGDSSYPPLCQLSYCYKPECAKPRIVCGQGKTEGRGIGDGHACQPSVSRPKNGPRASP